MIPATRVSRSTLAFSLVLSLVLLGPLATPAHAQDPGAQAPHRIVVDPPSLELERGDEARITIQVLDAEGRPVNVPVRVAAPRQALAWDDGTLQALAVGLHQLVVTEVVEADQDRTPAQATVPVEVRWPALARIQVEAVTEGRLYEGTLVRFAARGFHADGSERDELEGIEWSVGDPSVAAVDDFGQVSAAAPGATTLEATAEGVTARVPLEVAAFPASTLEIEGGAARVRTGDVQAFRAVARDGAGRIVDDLPIEWSHSYRPPDHIPAPPAPGRLHDGRMVADVPGEYTVRAAAGPLTARFTFRAEERDAVRNLEVVGQARQDHVRTTDFWVFEGLDGRDYVITGAKMSDGHAYVFDVTDPAHMVKTDSIQVDARSINDVKVSPDGRYASLTREGASDRRNGLVILDLANPAHPVVAAEVTDGLTGGVHNAFPTNDHVFALSAGEKYLIINVEDIYNPYTVSEVRHGDCRIHDVWVHDGVAYSAQWGCGVIAYDVGNGRWGGSLENPVYVGSYVVPGGATHAVFPYHQESTGRFYLFIGDEIMNRRGLAWQGVPGNYQIPYDPETGQGGTILSTRGYIQVIDFTDPRAPEMVARYEVPEFGTHNIWVEDDVLYQAYYEGGLRVVDVSGDLMGNLYTQGREIAVYRSADPIGYVPNSPMVWSAMPFKGYIFFTDTNSGVWAVELAPTGEPVM